MLRQDKRQLQVVPLEANSSTTASQSARLVRLSKYEAQCLQEVTKAGQKAFGPEQTGKYHACDCCRDLAPSLKYPLPWTRSSSPLTLGRSKHRPWT